ncbi:uroporphyrinogen-III synthase [Vibrio navarrensis]|uniref:uroporphyrinogen-III synthase n=1 Tax=Vibrio navarrensis TaxID=29495 RepID=UPI001869D2D1|nr:uroporphyrinogen-III synthase [Vibrio navarrensis]EJK2116219.1 uroporphyrinogen-III synthase [Vibrio navarrensis]MBE4582563.1 uroporphyrinogen-III synthase [Vibrio navarrensis]MBE4589905.1 uroporphyrinogen-III synthase [Vibrio navarrensis]
MTVLVTRPAEQGLALCSLLNDGGVSTLHHPLIRIVANPSVETLLSQLRDSDIVIAVSQHAVQFAQQWLAKHQANWPQNTRYLAVGQKTAHYLSKVTGQDVNYPTVSDSEHLIQLPELNRIAGKRVLILRGNGGRELIRESLFSLGADVDYCETYQREFIPFDPLSCVASWQAQKVDTLIVTSSEQLEYLNRMMHSQAQQWLHQQHLLVPSERIAAIAHSLGFARVTNVGSAANMELLAALQPK